MLHPKSLRHPAALDRIERPDPGGQGDVRHVDPDQPQLQVRRRLHGTGQNLELKEMTTLMFRYPTFSLSLLRRI